MKKITYFGLGLLLSMHVTFALKHKTDHFPLASKLKRELSPDLSTILVLRRSPATKDTGLPAKVNEIQLPLALSIDQKPAALNPLRHSAVSLSTLASPGNEASPKERKLMPELAVQALFGLGVGASTGLKIGAWHKEARAKVMHELHRRFKNILMLKGLQESFEERVKFADKEVNDLNLPYIQLKKATERLKQANESLNKIK